MVRATFAYDRSQREGRRRLLWVTILIVFLVLMDVASGGRIRALVKSGASGLWNMTAQVRAALFSNGYFTSHASLAAENAALREALAKSQEDAASYSALKAQNDELQALVHIASEAPGITAPVVSSVFASPYGTFLIGAGENSVSVGDLVLTADSFVVAAISDVSDRTATAKEIFAPNTTVNVIIGKNAAQAEGRGGGNARARLPRDAAVLVGDVVVAPELGGRAVGVVGKIDSSPAAAEQIVYIVLPVGLDSLKFVYLTHRP
ncbi:MAG TPA: rod shape-determining protein MreC [Candidatus Paceibacterota bacterium]|jgi:cell shape-determining protein MreC|nr:rod shape-determining protein MreC [Candidatus Paceibacterota bacterium]